MENVWSCIHRLWISFHVVMLLIVVYKQEREKILCTLHAAQIHQINEKRSLGADDETILVSFFIHSSFYSRLNASNALWMALNGFVCNRFKEYILFKFLPFHHVVGVCISLRCQWNVLYPKKKWNLGKSKLIKFGLYLFLFLCCEFVYFGLLKLVRCSRNWIEVRTN